MSKKRDDQENIIKKLVLNYTTLTSRTRKESIENFPIITNKYFPELIPEYLVLYSEKNLYEMDNSAVCFYLFDNEFNGQHGLWCSIYYNNTKDLNYFYNRFVKVKMVIKPDYSLVI